MKKTLVLVAKDLFLHRRSILGSWIVICAFVFLLITSKPGSPDVVFDFLTVINLLAVVMYSEWLVYRERTKGTFVWLRSLPVSDIQIVSSKFLAHSVMVSSSFFVSVAVLAPSYFSREHFRSCMLRFFELQAFGFVMVASRWRLGQKLGQGQPFAILGIPMIAFVKLREKRPSVAMVITDWQARRSMVLVLVLACVALGAAALYGMWKWFGAQDTRRLMD